MAPNRFQRGALVGALIELAIATATTGSATPDDIEWAEVLALAGLYVESTVRSDSIRWKLSGEVTEVTDSYEVNTVNADDPKLDMASFYEARRAHAASDGRARSADADTTWDATSQTPDPDEVIPDFSLFDDSLRADIGCSISDLVAVYSTLMQWSVTNSRPVAVVAVDDIVEAVHLDNGGDKSQLRAAVDALSLFSEAIRAEGVQPWKGRSRDNRTVARP